MAEEIQKRFDVQAHLIDGSGGAFEVRLGDELIFSKKKQGRFPEAQEIISSLEARGISPA